MPTTPRKRAKRTPKKSVQRAALYTHMPHSHKPRNTNQEHHQELAAQSVGTKIAVWVTVNVGTIQCTIAFAVLGISSIVALLTNSTLLALIFGALSSYFLQLVLLPIISLGQNILARKQELLAEETYRTTVHTLHNDEQLVRHMHAQDAELIAHGVMLRMILDTLGVAHPGVAEDAPAPDKRRKGKNAVPSGDTAYDKVTG